MSTGIPPRKGVKQLSSSISLEYNGKHPENWFFEQPCKEFFHVLDQNGGGKNKFFFGDNADVLRYLLKSGFSNKVRLVYIDPPFATASDFVSRNQIHAYSDSICGSEFVEFLRERLVLLRELLASDGSIYLHLDGKMAFQMKIIMDEIFGENNYISCYQIPTLQA